MTELQQLQQAIAALEAKRPILGEAVVEAALGPMRENLTHFPSLRLSGSYKKREFRLGRQIN